MTLPGEEFLRRFLLHVLPDRFVRIRYYGLLANRHREKALALCREVLPGSPARKIEKTDWREQLESLTGIDPMRCEVCGQKALRLVGELAPARAPEGSAAMTQSLIAPFRYLFAQPWSRGVVYPTGSLRYNRRREIAVVEPRHAAESSMDGPLQPQQRLSWPLWRPVRVSREAPAHD